MKFNSQSQHLRYTEIPLPQAVVFYCEEYGIEHIVISAGSRNAPLTNGFAEHPFFKTYSIVDERAAAFLHWAWRNNSAALWQLYARLDRRC